jgi:cbb3-type cytochrome oxidase subunit 3
MPSRKQRRRREKLKRHEYEYVIETEEGDEVVVERPTDGSKRDEPKTALAPRDRRGREMPKPSMGRVLRRTAIFAPLILVVVYLMGGDSTTGQKIGSAVTLIAFFIPFSYLIDVFMYRTLQRRQQRARASRN